MTKTNFMDKYPVYSFEIQKSETKLSSVSEIIEHLKTHVDGHKIAVFISVFNHYKHTQSVGGDINPDIKDAQNLIFCFGKALPKTTMLAARPRSIGVCELENSFMVEFMEAPKEELNAVIQSWIETI